jgi:hypothetical protein
MDTDHNDHSLWTTPAEDGILAGREEVRAQQQEERDEIVWPTPTETQCRIARRFEDSLKQAYERHTQHISDIRAELNRIGQWVAREATHPYVDWGDVGTLGEVHQKLTQLARWLYNEEE